eukprot:COSAG01_NODE_16701_length_1213_cov_1.237882_2_plen_217_part_00
MAVAQDHGTEPSDEGGARSRCCRAAGARMPTETRHDKGRLRSDCGYRARARCVRFKTPRPTDKNAPHPNRSRRLLGRPRRLGGARAHPDATPGEQPLDGGVGDAALCGRCAPVTPTDKKCPTQLTKTPRSGLSPCCALVCLARSCALRRCGHSAAAPTADCRADRARGSIRRLGATAAEADRPSLTSTRHGSPPWLGCCCRRVGVAEADGSEGMIA